MRLSTAWMWVLTTATFGIVLTAVVSAEDLNPLPCPIPASQFEDPSFTALPGAKAFFGRYEGGLYQIEIPDKWNGELVVYQHGAVAGPAVRVQVPDLRKHWVERGYAWTASSFRCNSPISGIGVIDTNVLADQFPMLTNRPAPKRTYVVGRSNGGGGVLLSLRYYPTRFAGGLAMCPADFQTLDYRFAIAAAAEVIGNVDLQDGSALKQVGEIFGSPGHYTEKGHQLASVQIELSGGPRPFAMEGLADRFGANIAGGVNSPALLAATNADVRYRIDPTLGFSEDVLNSKVRRQQADLKLRTQNQYQDLMPLDLRIQRPVITIHGTGDLQVPITLERKFKEAADKSGTSRLLVQRIMRIAGHCQFSEQEQIQAFDDLVQWVTAGKRPAGDNVMDDFRNAGRKFTNPIRSGDPGTMTVNAAARNTELKNNPK